jgi:hypothetical protein
MCTKFTSLNSRWISTAPSSCGTLLTYHSTHSHSLPPPASRTHRSFPHLHLTRTHPIVTTHPLNLHHIARTYHVIPDVYPLLSPWKQVCETEHRSAPTMASPRSHTRDHPNCDPPRHAHDSSRCLPTSSLSPSKCPTSKTSNHNAYLARSYSAQPAPLLLTWPGRKRQECPRCTGSQTIDPSICRSSPPEAPPSSSSKRTPIWPRRRSRHILPRSSSCKINSPTHRSAHGTCSHPEPSPQTT